MEHVEAAATATKPEPELDEALARAIRQLIAGLRSDHVNAGSLTASDRPNFQR